MLNLRDQTYFVEVVLEKPLRMTALSQFSTVLFVETLRAVGIWSVSAKL